MKNEHAIIIPLAQCAADDVEKLLDAAFGKDRKGRTAYLLRAAMDPIAEMSFGLIHDGKLVGSIQCWPVILKDEMGEMASLRLVGPVAVSPDRQSEGFGHVLMNAMLDASEKAGNPALVMIGDAEYYGRFGFTADATSGWQLPGPWEPHRLLLRNIGNHPLPKKGIIGPDNR